MAGPIVADSQAPSADPFGGRNVGDRDPRLTARFLERLRETVATSITRSEQGLGVARRSVRVPAAQDRPGAIVVGGDYQGLGIIRSLGRNGVPVCVIDDERSIGRFSRFITHSVRVEDLRDPEEVVDRVIEAGQRLGLGGWVLYPTRDETVAAFARHRARLCEMFRVPTPKWDTVKWAWDKRNTYRLASDLGIPTPRTWYPEDESDLVDLDVVPPAVIKPAIKEEFFYATKAKAWRADTRADVLRLYQDAAALVRPGEVMIQELVPGGGSQQFAYCGFFKNGRPLATMVVRRRRQHPPEFGRASTYVETVDVPILEELSERFLREIDYYGLVELEYKMDPRNGEYKLLDVNARTWGYHTLGSGAGVDFPMLQYKDQMGDPVEPCRARVGVRWVRLLTDLPTSLVEMFRGKLVPRDYLRSLREADTESVFDRDDPLPGLVELALFPYLLVKRGF